uniref:Nucleolar protein 16 n=1 Tax=Anopheles atroparvus TaxID=41427 RepID=A0A182J5F4_ANOAO
MVRRLRKTKKNQKYDYNRNRKRICQKVRRNGNVKCPEIKRAYNPKKDPEQNIREMGLAYDVNRAIPIPKFKQQMKEMALELNALANEEDEEAIETEKPPKREPRPRAKQYVADELERAANEFAGVRYRMPRPQVRQITSMIDQHGFNYYAMERDRRNYEQETWRQFRRKIRKFLKLTEQSMPYLERKGWLDCDMSDPIDPRWKEYGTDDES